MSSQLHDDVAEGHLPPGQRPSPGLRPEREVWTGQGTSADPAASDGSSADGPGARTAPVDAAAPRSGGGIPQGAVTRKVATADGRRTRRRLMGVDATRAFALVGMVAVHTLPAARGETSEPTLQWSLFAGHSAALFAVLAGISLAFLTGGPTPRRGLEGRRARTAILVRSALLLLIGLTVNLLSFPAFDILVYYALMFLLAIPFTLLRPRTLFALAAACAIVMPFVMQSSLSVLPAPVHTDPSFGALLSEPGVVAGQLLLTGTFPALPWMTFILLGMALGRLPLSRDRLQVLLVLVGAVVAAVARGISWLMFVRFDLRDRLAATEPGMTAADVQVIQTFGPNPSLPDSSRLWLLVSGPHTSTPFALLESAGMAMIALGAFLLLSRVIGKQLSWLGAMGSMTLTLYVSHLFFLSFVDTSWTPWFWLLVQLSVGALGALAWQRALGSGPLERIVTRVSRRSAAALVRDRREAPSHRATGS